MEKYNIPFCIDELLDALSNSKDSAVRPDDIHYQMLKHLPSETLNALLSILNGLYGLYGLLVTFLLVGASHM